MPGVFTRQAYEGYIAGAIEEAVKRRDVSTDWVLAGAQAGNNQPSLSADELRAALTEQYFADYAEHWQDFMNALQWDPAPTLPAAIGQLKLLADARQSPVIALMKSLEYQVGAGVQKASLSDTLVNKAKDMLSSQGDARQAAKAEPAGPLDAAFGPVLRLMGQSGQGTANSDLSLQRFLEGPPRYGCACSKSMAAPTLTNTRGRWPRRCSRARARNWPTRRPMRN